MMVEPLNDPWAVPLTFRLFPHVALNEPFADEPVCSVTFHLKSVQDEADGTTLVDDQVPMSELMPVEDGLVGEVPWSNPTQPTAAAVLIATKPQARM